MNRISIIFERKWGTSKLQKPESIKGKPDFNILYTATEQGKCKCPVYIIDDNIYILHRDWHSCAMKAQDFNEIYGTNIKTTKKFVYADGFKIVILRNEAWIEVKDIMIGKISHLLNEVMIEMLTENNIFDMADYRLISDAILRARNVE